MRIILYLFPVSGLFVVSSFALNTTQNSCPAILKPLPSDPAFQSGSSSVIISSSADYSEYLCASGIGYEGTGISCYSLKCLPSNYGYGPRPPPLQLGQLGSPNGVDHLAAQVETAYPCWKLRQLRLNNYVYLVCFVKNYASILFQVAFKENNQLQLLPSENLPYSGLTSLSKAQFTAENGYGCLLAIYSSFPANHLRDRKREPSDLLAPIYTICPNNYKWFFCGHINLEDTIDVALWYSQESIRAIFVQVRQMLTCNTLNAVQTNYALTPLIQYTISPNVDRYECPSSKTGVISTIGADNQPYTLCGIRQCVVASGQNGTILCCAVTVDHTCLIPGATSEPYSSFCIKYDVVADKFVTDQVIFLGGSEGANDVQYVRGNGDCCQFIITANPSGPLLAYPISSIVGSLNNQTAAGAMTINPVNLGNDHMFGNAVACTFKSRCCNSQATCMSCTRPAKYGDQYLGSMTCGNTGTSNPYQNYPNPNRAIVEEGVPTAYGPQPPRQTGDYTAPTFMPQQNPLPLPNAPYLQQPIQYPPPGYYPQQPVQQPYPPRL